MKKVKLSEVKINATTLNNQPASYYNSRLFGLGGMLPVKYDANDANVSGFYQGSSLSDANYPSPVAWYLLMAMFRSSNTGMQISISFSDFRRYRRFYSFGVWSEWIEFT